MNLTAFSARIPAVFACACIAVSMLADASAGDRNPPPIPVIWPVAETAQKVAAAVPSRVLQGDESWDAATPRFQDLDTGDATRTVTLAPVGASGVAPGTAFLARVHVRKGHRVLFRQNDGELLAFWNGDAPNPTQWAVLRAGATGWEARVSTGKAVIHGDPAFAWLGAVAKPRGDEADAEFVMPGNPRTNGFAIRFETDAPLFFVSCRADAPHFRVLADGKVVADVDVQDRSGIAINVPIDLGAPMRRRIEILADRLEFRGVELPDVRQGVFAWSGAVPPVRMLWIGDNSTDLETRAYPWMVGRLLGYEVWSRRWGHHAQNVVGADRNAVPEAAIAEDITEINPDVIVFGGVFFDPDLPPNDYNRVVAAWFNAIRKAARPEAVKVVLPSFETRTPIDRMTDRRAALIAKEAKSAGFQYVNWQGWITGNRAEPELGGNAAQFISENGVYLSADGNAYVAARFAEDIRKRDVGLKAQLASVKRQQAQRNQNLASSETAP